MGRQESMEKEARRGFRFIDDLTSDVFFEAWGHTPEDMFVSAAEALVKVSADVRKLKPKKAVLMEAKGKDIQDLMFSWLQEVILAMEVEEMFFCNFEIQSLSKDHKHIKATAFGETMRTSLGGTHVKGVTYYKFSVKKDGDLWKATVSLDV